MEHIERMRVCMCGSSTQRMAPKASRTASSLLTAWATAPLAARSAALYAATSSDAMPMRSLWTRGRLRPLPGCVGVPVGEESRTGRARAARGGAGGSTAGRRRRRAEQLGEGGGDDGGDDSDDGLDELVGALGP